MAPPKLSRKYSEVRGEIRDMVLLAWRNGNLRGKLIKVAGRSDYVHTECAIWWGEDLCSVGMRFSGGSVSFLSEEVDLSPGKIDVYEANPDDMHPEYDRVAAARVMKRMARKKYGFLNLFLAFLHHCPVLRFVFKPNTDDEYVSGRAPYCSHACAVADRVGGKVDPVPNLADYLTEPGDLARSKFYRYTCTLIPG